MPRRMQGGSSMNGQYSTRVETSSASPSFSKIYHDHYNKSCQENGLDAMTSGEEKGSEEAHSSTTPAKRFETFVMTGDMIIKTTSPHHKSNIIRRASIEKKKPSSPQVASDKREEFNSEVTCPESPSRDRKNGDAKSKIPCKIPKPSPKHSPKVCRTPPTVDSAQESVSAVDKLWEAQDSHLRAAEDLSQRAVDKLWDVIGGSSEALDSGLHYESMFKGSEIPSYEPPPPEPPLPQEEFPPIYGAQNTPTHVNLDMYPSQVSESSDYQPWPEALPLEVTQVTPMATFAGYDLGDEEDLPPMPDVPDDLSSEDDLSRMDGLMNMDDLPPPPEELLYDLPLQHQTESETFENSIEDSLMHLETQTQQVEPEIEFVEPDLPQFSEVEFKDLDKEKDIVSLPSDTLLPGYNTDSTMVTETTTMETVRSMVTSKSAEKITYSHRTAKQPVNAGGVRSSKSHETCLENMDGMTLVTIDFDDNMASSVDALHYKPSLASLEHFDTMDQDPILSRSLDNSPERRLEKHSERIFMPTFISLEEPRSISKLKEGGRVREFVRRPEEQPVSPMSVDKHSVQETDTSKEQLDEERKEAECISENGKAIEREEEEMEEDEASPSDPVSNTELQHENMQYVEPQVHITRMTPSDSSDSGVTLCEIEHSRVSAEPNDDGQVDSPPPQVHVPSYGPPSPPSPENGDSDADSVYHQPAKDADKPSALRLAQRLYHLDGFKRTDVSRHLGKKNDFSQLVGEEYLKHFDFTNETLDLALRKFLKHLSLAGETQERERVLVHFSRRFIECNPGTFNSEDACHTLTCALMLLNTDLHGQNIGRKMTLGEFIENLADLNDGDNFPRDVLKALYQAIKGEPLECEFEEELDELEVAERRLAQPDGQAFIGVNPFLEVPDPSKTKEYKKGYVMRKSCIDQDGRKTPFGKRGWKMFYASLRDMVLYLHKDEYGFKKNTMYDNMGNAIRIHHALATKASDYTKKQHVFRLQTSDWAQYLFQTGDSKELQEWMDTINFVAATLSAPPLPGGVGSQRKFQRPLLPSSYTRLNLREQLEHHEAKVEQLQLELLEHRRYPPEKGAKSRVIHDYTEKETYVQFELKRFETYVYLLQSKMAAYPELEPSLVETAIGEVDEPISPSGSPVGETAASKIETNSPNSPGKQERRGKPVQRSVSDRSRMMAAKSCPNIVVDACML